MKTLHLNLKREWFKMILSGEKKEEYRDLTNYWFNRLYGKTYCNFQTGKEMSKQATKWMLSGKSTAIQKRCKPNSFDTITFSNGYAKDRPQIVVEFKGIKIREGKTEWGAKEGEKYFVLKLGGIIKTNNLELYESFITL